MASRAPLSLLFLFFASLLLFPLSSWVYDVKVQPTGIFYNSNSVFISTVNSELYALNARDGSLNFKYPSSSLLSNPAFGGGKIFIAQKGGGIAVLDERSGKELERFSLNESADALYFHKGMLIAREGSSLIFLNPLTGDFLFRLEGGQNFALADFAGDMAALAGEGSLSLFDIANRSLLWRVPLAGVWETPPIITQWGVLAGTTDSKVQFFSLQNGALLWERPLADWPGAEMALEGERVFLGTNDNKMLLVNLTNGEIVWEFEGGSAFQSKPVISGHLLACEQVLPSKISEDKGLCRDGSLLACGQVLPSKISEDKGLCRDGSLLAAGTNEDGLYFLGQESGRDIARLALHGRINYISGDGGKGNFLYTATSKGKVHALSLSSLCTIESPAPLSQVGSARERLSGRAFSKYGNLSVYVSVNRGPWQRAAGNESWHAYFEPAGILEGPFEAECKVEGQGFEEKGVFTTITLERADDAPKKRMSITAPVKAAAGGSFSINVSDEYLQPVGKFAVEWEGRVTNEGSGSAILQATSPGRQPIFVFAEGYLAAQAMIEVEKREDYAPYFFILILGFVILAALKFFLKKKKGKEEEIPPPPIYPQPSDKS